MREAARRVRGVGIERLSAADPAIASGPRASAAAAESLHPKESRTIVAKERGAVSVGNVIRLRAQFDHIAAPRHGLATFLSRLSRYDRPDEVL